MKKFSVAIIMTLVSTIMLSGCGKKNEVVIYTAVEQVFAEKIFDEFEKKTGIKVMPVYDTEANKTTGLVNRIKAEKDSPVCDVFWNNEFIQTIDLQEDGLLGQYVSSVSEDIPDAYKDADGYWTAIGGRARVMLVNTDLLAKNDYPEGIFDFAYGPYAGSQEALALPAFGTTKTHAAAIYAYFGREEAKKLYQTIKNSGVQIVDGNSVTKDMVVSGQVLIGYTDTDDAKEAIEDGAHVEIVYPDQGEGDIGTLITPSTVAMIKNSPNEANAKKLIDFIISKENENRLIEEGFFDVSVRENQDNDFAIKGMDLNLHKIYEMLDVAATDMEEIFNTAN